MSYYCHQRKIPFVITSAISNALEDKALNRTSKTHIEGRAADISLQGWSSTDRELFTSFFNGKYNTDYGAISASSGKKNLIYHHDSGHGAHLHIQVRR